MYQGLGETYINTFFWLTAIGFLTAAILLALIRVFTGAKLIWCVLSAPLIGIVLSYFTNSWWHHDMFVRSHQTHNHTVPTTGCLRYDPSFSRLFAAYSMSREEFEKWVVEHPWKLQPYDLALLAYDSEQLSFTQPETAYATEVAPNGGQLRVYFKDGVMYLSYNVM